LAVNINSIPLSLTIKAGTICYIMATAGGSSVFSGLKVGYSMRRCLACDHSFSSNGKKCPSCLESPMVVDGFPTYAPEFALANEWFEPEFFERLFSLESRSFWFRARNKFILWAIRKYFPSAKKNWRLAAVRVLFSRPSKGPFRKWYFAGVRFIPKACPSRQGG